jgi:SAM-dependent methyltransferase
LKRRKVYSVASGACYDAAMGSRWFAPHAAGFGPLVARLVARDIPGSSPAGSDDSAVAFSSAAEPRAVLSYCRALFRVLGEAAGGLERAACSFEGAAGSIRFAGGAGRWPRSFVLRAFDPGDPAPLPPDTRRALEEAIARSTGLRPDSARPDREFRVQERSDGSTYFLERMGSPAEAPARNGELPRTTCRLLAEMTEPRPDDVFLDPFCGYGGIALERALAAPYRFVFASDLESEKTAAVKASMSERAFERRRKTIFVKARDALDPEAFDSGFVTAIATDPPWGLWQGGPGAGEAERLMGAFLVEAARLLAPGGRLVLLAARGAIVEPGADFALAERLDVLVSGKKAKVLRFDRA